MYYLKISNKNTDEIVYYCRKCGDTDNTIIKQNDSFCVSKTHIEKKQKFIKI